MSDCDLFFRSQLLLLEPVELTDEEMSWVATNDGSLVSEELELKYQHYSAHEVLQAVLPVEIVKDVPSSFEQIGHIAHLNLREEQLPYKGIIGMALINLCDMKFACMRRGW